MPLMLLVTTIVFSLAALATAAYYAALHITTALSLRSSISAREGLKQPPSNETPPSVCVVVPAHNELDVIGDLADSLLRQDYPKLRVVFALDRCTDNTEALLRERLASDDRFEIISIDACPDAWAGKVHAVYKGVELSASASDADLLLFTDADTIFDPACVRACVATLRVRRLDMLSLLSTLSTAHWWERLVQPAAAFELLRHFPIHKVNQGRSAFANGQFMLFRRDAYLAIGGHQAVRSDLLEDLAFARLLKRGKHTVGVAFADGLLTCRMYASLGEFRRGWKRIYIDAAKQKTTRLRQWALRELVVGVVGPAASAVCLALGVTSLLTGAGSLGALALSTSVAALVMMWLFAAFTRRVQHAPMMSALLHPLGSLVVWSILREAAADLHKGRGVQWAGRTYLRQERSIRE